MVTKLDNKITNIKYSPDGLFKNGHFQTIYSALFHNPVDLVDLKRILIEINTSTSIECDYNLAGEHKSDTCVILIHGLEGSSKSNYCVSVAHKAIKKGFDVIRMNLRNCGDTHHLSNTFYNSGLTEDAKVLLQYCIENLNYKHVYITGFSLGANIVLKLGGELKEKYPEELIGICSMSPPLDLQKCSHAILLPQNKIYDIYYTRRLFKTVKKKKEFFPDLINLDVLKKIHNLYDFDNLITAPHFNYKDAEDYYRHNSTLQYLEHIKVPTLIIQAKDDPIIPEENTEKAMRIHNPNIHYLFTNYGGHVGFVNSKKHSTNDTDIFWGENRIIEFLENLLN